MFPPLSDDCDNESAAAYLVPDPTTICEEVGSCILAFDSTTIQTVVLPTLFRKFSDEISPPVKDWSRHFFWVGPHCAISPFPRTVQSEIVVRSGYTTRIAFDRADGIVSFEQHFVTCPDGAFQCGRYDSVCHAERVSMQWSECKIVLIGILDETCQGHPYYVVGVVGNSINKVLELTKRLSKSIGRCDDDTRIDCVHSVFDHHTVDAVR